MTMLEALKNLMFDEIQIEPFSSETGARAQSFGASVTYSAQVTRGAKRIIGSNGREIMSSIQVIIPERVHVDQRSRVTLPTGFIPNQPPILGIEPLKGLGLDHTALYFGLAVFAVLVGA